MDAAAENIFTTPRLIVRNFAPDDWRRLQSFGGKPEVAQMMASLKSPWPESDVKAWMARGPYRGKLGFRAGMFLPKAGLIGFVGIGGKEMSCAFAIDPAFWGQGYASEALRGLLAHCFDHLELDETSADHFTDNSASGYVLRKVGFVETGQNMGDSLARPEPAPLVTYRLTRSQFRAA